MPNITIKQEKEDSMEAENPAPVSKPDRNISWKKKKLITNKLKVKKKDKTSLDKVKVKTFDEIMREKKIKKEKTKEVFSWAESTPSSSTTTTMLKTPIRCSANLANIKLRQFSIPLMALPKGKHMLQTFVGNSCSGVQIKREPVDPGMTSSIAVQKSPSVTPIQVNHTETRQLNGTGENLFIRIKNKMKSEHRDEDLNHNDVPNHTQHTTSKEMPSQGGCDSLSEPSEGSSEQLSTSMDFSDVPLGSTQDDDTMSLFAFDDTFEEEIESEKPRKFISDSAQRRASKERDLRETLQNRSRKERSDQANKVEEESCRHTIEDTNVKESDMHTVEETNLECDMRTVEDTTHEESDRRIIKDSNFKKKNDARETSKRERYNNGNKKQNNERRKDDRISRGIEDNGFKVPHGDGSRNISGGRKKNKLRFRKLKNNMNVGNSVPSAPYLDPNFVTNISSNPALRQELQRLEQLQQVVLSANQPVSLISPFLKNENPLQYRQDGKRLDNNSGRFRDGISVRRNQDGPDSVFNDKKAYSHLRNPPPVAGGRGFFQDFKEGNKEMKDFSDKKYEDHNIAGGSRCERNGRVVAIGDTSGDRFAKSNDVTNKGTSPTDFDSFSRSRRCRTKEETSNYRLPLKRRSREDYDGDRAAKEAKREKQVYCGTQLRLGECHHSYCRLCHLTPSELTEYQETGKIKVQGVVQDKSDQPPEPPELPEPPEQPEPPEPPEPPIPVSQKSYSDEKPARMQQVEDDGEKEQMCKGLAKAANQLLDSLKLGEAWQVIFHLYQNEPVNREPLIKLLERTLFLCGEDGVDNDVAAQVSAQVFDMIPKVRGNYNRHDFTTLIHCLCHTGQYIRGYEVLDEMRKSNITATHEVYLDLIQCSDPEPNWAFNLIEEVKSLGLFKGSICSALILLGAKSGKPLLERTWMLFKDMMENSVKPTKESYLALLDLLAENNEGQKLLDALVEHNDPTVVPSAKCNKIIIKHSKGNAEMVSINVASVCEIAKKKDPLLDVETWNVLLRNCYSDKFNLVAEAQQTYGMMKRYNIPLTAEGYNSLLCALSEANQTISAMEVFNTLSQASGHLKVSDYRPCIDYLIGSLIRSKQLEDLELVVTFAVDNGLMVEEKALLLFITKMELEKKFEEIHQLFKKLQSTKDEIPVSVFRKLVSTLEKWADNPAASLAVYAAMRRSYPIIPDNSQQINSSSSDMTSGHGTHLKRRACRYFWTTKGCIFESACRFSHAPSDAPFIGQSDVAAINSPSPEKNNPFVLRSASFPLCGQPMQPPPRPPAFPFPLSTAAPSNPLVQSPVVFASSSPFVLKDPNLLTAFQPPAVPRMPFPLGFPQGSLFSPSIPVSASTSIQYDQKMSIPSSIQAGGERHSVDLGSTATSVCTTDTRGSHSAPIMSESLSNEGFLFPVKTEVQFYKAKILKATEEKDLEELARLYVQMKKEQVPANNEMLLLFYNCFITCKDIGESLSSFVAIIDIQLDNLDIDEDSSQKEALDIDDLRFIGELGVALMQFCRLQKRLDEGYLILHVLHQYGVNYFQCPASFVPNGKVLSSQSIALLATDMCLCLNKDPQFDGAVEVLRGCNYAIPLDGSFLSSEEAEKRRSTFEKLSAHYLIVGNYALVYELLQHVGDKDVFGMTSLKSIYNELLKRYIAEKKVDDAIGVIREMENELISRDPNVLRALVTCLGNIARFVQASEIFKSSCLQGAYPAFPTGDELWKATVWITFSKFEIQFYLEHHLQLLNKYVEQNRIASQLPYDEKHFKSLRIIITKEESDGTACDMTIDAAKEMQEKIIDILCSDFNPPLSCGKSDKVGEVIVNPRSLRRWFLANPPPERQMQNSPLSESDGSTELTRNVIASKGKPGITIRVENPYHNDLQKTTLYDEYEPRIRHTVCGHLTRYLRQGKLANKEEFKRLARELTQDFLRSSNLADLNTDYKQVRGRVVSFVDKFFDKGTGPNGSALRNQEV